MREGGLPVLGGRGLGVCVCVTGAGCGQESGWDVAVSQDLTPR